MTFRNTAELACQKTCYFHHSLENRKLRGGPWNHWLQEHIAMVVIQELESHNHEL